MTEMKAAFMLLQYYKIQRISQRSVITWTFFTIQFCNTSKSYRSTETNHEKHESKGILGILLNPDAGLAPVWRRFGTGLVPVWRRFVNIAI
jgi:hypothetical protein